MQVQSQKRWERDNNFDLLRIVSTITVILIHSNYIYFGKHFAEPSGSLVWSIEALINIMTRFSVPAFVMISGAYNINKGRGIDFYIKTSYKIFLPLVVAIVLMLPVDIITEILNHENPVYLIKPLLSGGYNNLWYLFMLAGLYILTPLINLMKKNVTIKQYRLIGVLLLLWSIGSQATSSQILPYSIGVVIAFVGYYVMGDIIYEFSKERMNQNYKGNRVIISLVAIICVIVSYFTRFMGFNYYVSAGFVTFFSPATVVFSLSIYYITSTISIRRDFSWLSGMTFYIYLFHTMILRNLQRILESCAVSEILSIIILTIMTFMFSLMVAVLFDKVWRVFCKKTKLFEIWKSMRLWKAISQ